MIAGSGSNKYILAASKKINDIAHSKFAESTTEGIKKASGGVNKAWNALLEKLGELISFVINSIKNKKG